MDRQRILIADDNEINRVLISGMLENKYELITAENGEEALAEIQANHADIDLILLDLIMPIKTGIEVLEEMNKEGWINDIPVIVISAENSSEVMKQAYELGAEDYINRPFDPDTVSRRIQKAILLHAQRKNLIDALTEEFSNRERQNDLMVNILSHIVESRNGESGQHVININIITSLLLEALRKRTQKYHLTDEDIITICNASSFHDIGKMKIPEEILNKPGRLTPEEFEVIKTHSMLGYEMMCDVSEFNDEPLVKYAKNICRYHHEKWDGRGYPDHLTGDEIPIEAQVVSMADVYDALTSERCYKPAYTHEQAISMITNGECGQFNPILFQCMNDVDKDLRTLKSGDTTRSHILSHSTDNLLSKKTINLLTETKDTDISRNIRLLRSEEKRHEAFKTITSEAWFEYYTNPEMLKFNAESVKLLGIHEKIINPFENEDFLNKCGYEFKNAFNVNSKDDEIIFEKKITLANGKDYIFKTKIFYTNSDKRHHHNEISGAVGKITEIGK